MIAAHSMLTHTDITSGTLVCLIDDDSSVRKSIGRLLESAGHHVQAFGEPEAFFRHLASNPVSLVILDIWMEHMNGIEVLAHLCAKSPETKVIFITGFE